MTNTQTCPCGDRLFKDKPLCFSCWNTADPKLKVTLESPNASFFQRQQALNQLLNHARKVKP